MRLKIVLADDGLERRSFYKQDFLFDCLFRVFTRGPGQMLAGGPCQMLAGLLGRRSGALLRCWPVPRGLSQSSEPKHYENGKV